MGSGLLVPPAVFPFPVYFKTVNIVLYGGDSITPADEFGTSFSIRVVLPLSEVPTMETMGIIKSQVRVSSFRFQVWNEPHQLLAMSYEP